MILHQIINNYSLPIFRANLFPKVRFFLLQNETYLRVCTIRMFCKMGNIVFIIDVITSYSIITISESSWLFNPRFEDQAEFLLFPKKVIPTNEHSCFWNLTEKEGRREKQRVSRKWRLRLEPSIRWFDVRMTKNDDPQVFHPVDAEIEYSHNFQLR